jgi:hypothetical protein
MIGAAARDARVAPLHRMTLRWGIGMRLLHHPFTRPPALHPARGRVSFSSRKLPACGTTYQRSLTMKRNVSLVPVMLVVLLAMLWLAGLADASRSAEPAAPLAPGAGAPGLVSYQGQVTVNGAAYTGAGYFKFAIVNAAGNTTYWSNDGASVNGGEPTAAVQLQVTNGLFDVLLGNTTLPGMTQSLTADAFSGVIRYLRVWFSADGASFTQLSPDRRIAAVPYAFQAEEVKNAWSLTGNSHTSPGTNFLGTTDNVALQLHVNGVRALRIEPSATSPNLIGGYSGNSVTADVKGAAIGGGGASGNINRVTDNYGTVGGGYGNGAGDNAGTTDDRSYATVGGGMDNWAAGAYSTIGGGTGNRATSTQATVAGGAGNTANNQSATVSGGASNTADGFGATVAGGVSNRAGGSYSFAAGFRAKALNMGSFVWADATNADFNSTADNQFAVRANGGVVFSTGAAAVTVNGNTVWHAGNDGGGSGLDADTLDGQHGAYYQARVGGACAVGSSIRAIAADGTVTCETDDNTTYAAGNQLSLAGTTFNVVEGSGSGLDADTLDGWSGDYYRVFMVASGSDSTTIITSTCRNYINGQITITAPRDGTVVVEANARMQLGHLNGTKDQLTLNLAATTTDCTTAPRDLVRWTIPAAYPSSVSEDYTFTVRRPFNVTAGAHTFYLNGVMDSGGAGDDQFWYARLHATFYPESAIAAGAAGTLEKEKAP